MRTAYSHQSDGRPRDSWSKGVNTQMASATEAGDQYTSGLVLACMLSHVQLTSGMPNSL